MTDDILASIDAAVVANLCGCGCGHQIPANGQSPDFVNEAHQQRWNNRGRTGKGLTEGGPATLPPCGNAHHDGSSWGCRECTPRHPVYDETPMARVVRETSSLRRAIDRIRGIIR